jgi:hypothetical protein
MFCERTVETERMRAHRELTKLAEDRARHDATEAKWILVAYRLRPDRALGYASFLEYLERLFGYGPRLANEKVRVAEALESLPDIAHALESGEIHWSCARELTRVATLATESAWLSAARGKSMREIEVLVSGRARGDRPEDRAKVSLELHTIYAKVSADTMALWRDAISAMKKAAGGGGSDDDAIRAIARAALGGPGDDGRAADQIVISRCADCKKVTQRGRGEELDVEPAVADCAACDSQTIDFLESDAPHAKQEIPPATRRAVLLRDHHRCVVPGCRHSVFVDVHHLRPRSEGGDHRPGLLVTLCANHHKMTHVGRLIIEGDPASGMRFTHADGTPYGASVNAERARIMSDAFSALKNLGFKHTECKAALEDAAAHVGQTLSFDLIVRTALRSLRSPRLSVRAHQDGE